MLFLCTPPFDEAKGYDFVLPRGSSWFARSEMALASCEMNAGDEPQPLLEIWERESDHNCAATENIPQPPPTFPTICPGLENDFITTTAARLDEEEHCTNGKSAYNDIYPDAGTNATIFENTLTTTVMANGTTNGVNGLASQMYGLTTDPPSRNGSMSPTSVTSDDALSPSRRHGRKESLPLAPPFITSAPGKTIVYGEHAVVHGKAAIAAAIDLRSYLLCTTLTKSKRTVTLRFVDIDLDHTWNIADLPWKAFAHPNKKKRYYDLVTSLDEELVEAMQPHVMGVSPQHKTETRKIHQAAASMFLYLFLSLGSEKSSPCIYTLRSTIPIGAGLGSSASISVCVAAALLLQCRALSGPHPDQQTNEAEDQLERINRWAFVGEMLIHGNPSGIDNTVATNGRAVLFQRKDYTKPPSVEILREFPELPLMLVDTCQPKSTAAEVAKVGLLKKTHPAVAEHIFSAIDAIVRSVYSAVTHDDFDSASTANIAHLGELMAINHGLLTSLGVSHPKLERLRYLVDQAGVGWTKLTGAGGGGCAITLLKPNPPTSGSATTTPDHAAVSDPQNNNANAGPGVGALQGLQRCLEKEGFEIFDTTLGGDGVGVLYPAVINGEEIDQDMFLTAEGREGVEELVGGKYDQTAWKYWRP